MRWTEEQYEQYQQRRRHNAAIANKRTIEAGGAGPSAKLESGAGPSALGAAQVKGGDTAQFLVRITSRRKRLLDIDNLCEKFHVDCLRYAGLLPSDAPSQTRIEVCQQKTAKGEAEEIHIEVTQL